MDTLKVPVRVLAAAILWVSLACASASGAHVIFDLPDTIECQDKTPPEFAAAHPNLKVIEGKLRISARIVEGSESEIVDFLYVIASPDKMLRFQDYLPNTTLESTVADDQIEITNCAEDNKAIDANARVGYKALGLGVGKTKGTKKTESNHYKQLVAKQLVLSSGTTDREHGIFFRMRPSNGATLEGAKEFTFLATVPKNWKGDWCTISCAAKSRHKSLFSTSIVPAGVEQVQIGMYLMGDSDASSLARELRQVQDAHAAVLAAQLAKDGEGLLDTMYAAVSSQAITELCGFFKTSKSEHQIDPQQKLADARKAVVDVQERLRQMAE